MPYGHEEWTNTTNKYSFSLYGKTLKAGCMDSNGAGVTGDCELPNKDAGSLGPLEEQYTLLTPELALLLDWIFTLMTLLRGTSNIILSVTVDQFISPPFKLMSHKSNCGRYQVQQAKIKVAQCFLGLFFRNAYNPWVYWGKGRLTLRGFTCK